MGTGNRKRLAGSLVVLALTGLAGCDRESKTLITRTGEFSVTSETMAELARRRPPKTSPASPTPTPTPTATQVPPAPTSPPTTGTLSPDGTTLAAGETTRSLGTKYGTFTVTAGPIDGFGNFGYNLDGQANTGGGVLLLVFNQGTPYIQIVNGAWQVMYAKGAWTWTAGDPRTTPAPTPSLPPPAPALTPIPAPAPAPAQPSGPAPALGIILENAGAASLPGGITSLGYVFEPGQMPSSSGLMATLGTTSQPVQVDVKNRYADGSIRMAVLSLARPSLASGQSLPASFAVGPASPGQAINLETALNGHSFTVDLAFTLGGSSITVDVLSALRSALTAGKANFWQQGPLATQARVEVLLPNSSVRLVSDVTAYNDGAIAVDVQYANDRSMEARGGRVSYTAAVTIDGRQIPAQAISDQLQYTSWRARYSSGGANGTQGLGSRSSGWLNIKRDIKSLMRVGAIAQYDQTLDMSKFISDWYLPAIQQPAFGLPLAVNGLETYMPNAGGRGDIGITTQANTVWLLSQDAVAARYALAQAETSGAVLWRMWDQANGTWLNSGNYPNLWTDQRGGTGTPGDRNSGGLTQQWEFVAPHGFVPEQSHQPDLSLIPYLMTGERWTLDNLLAQGAWNTVANWPGGERTDSSTGKTGLVMHNGQIRGAAWSIRQLENAAYGAPDGTVEQAFFRKSADDNWAWAVSNIPKWTAEQGAVHGYLPGWGTMPAWQQDYLVSSVVSAARRGSRDALAYLNWSKNFIVGRFEQEANGLPFRDAVVNFLVVGDPNGIPYAPFTSWAQVGAATYAAGGSNTDPTRAPTGWDRSGNGYGLHAMSALAAIHLYTGDARARAAYERLARENPPWTTQADFVNTSQFGVTIPGIYGGWIGSP